MSEDGADKPSGGRGAHPLKYSRKLPTEALTGLATELAGESSSKLCDGAFFTARSALARLGAGNGP